MQKRTNKMARASWKFHFFKYSEIEDYINYLTDYEFTSNLNTDRRSTVTRLNFFKLANLSTGKVDVDRVITKHHFSFKLGQLIKNRKPFYFRSKKKKNVTKKNNLS